MANFDITQDLINLGEKDYALFEAKLSPTINPKSCVGVRLPKLREYEKKIRGTKEANDFLNNLPHKYFDENMLHAILLSHEKDFNKALTMVDDFLPYANSWAIVDTMCPKVFFKEKYKSELKKHVLKWAKSKKEYTCRFGIDVLMNVYLDVDEKELISYLDLVSSIRSDKYYINMMIAWYFATALTYRYDVAIKYIENNKLDIWTHNKAIQKAKESFRVSNEIKSYLSTLKR